MYVSEFPSPEQSNQLRNILENLQRNIQNLPDVFQSPLTSDLKSLYAFLTPPSPTSQEASFSAPNPEETAYLFAQKITAEAMHLLESILNSLNVAIFVFDQNGIIRRTNHYAINMIGFDPIQMTSKQFYSRLQILGKDAQPLDEEQIPSILAARGETVTRERIQIITETGQTNSILFTAMPAYIHGEFTGVFSIWDDITELNLLSTQIEAERDQLRTILKSISDEVWYSDLNGKVTLMNEEAGHNLGFENPEEINHHPNEDMLKKLEIFNMDGTARKPDETPLLKSLAGVSYRGQEIVRNKETGKTMIREYTSAPIRSKDYFVIGSVSVVRDISEQKRRETFLRENENRERAHATELEAIMAAVPAIILVTRDPLARVMTGNPAAHHILRIMPGQNFSKTGLSGVSPRHYRVFHEGRELAVHEMPMETCASTGKPVLDFQEDLLFEDGSIVNLLGNVTPLLNDARQPAGAVGAFVDITKQKEAEKALRANEARLRESDQRFRIALASTPIVVFNIDQDLRYTWLYSNHPGIAVNEYLGKRDDEIRPAEDVEQLMEVKRVVVQTGQPVHQEVMIRIHDYWAIFVADLDPLLSSNGEVCGLTGSILDITQQRRLESLNKEQRAQMEIQRQLLESREKERLEIARDLHDGPIQLLSGALFNVQIGKQSIQDLDRNKDFENIGQDIKQAVHELREMVNELRPPATIQFGLASAIKAYAYNFTEKHPDLNLTLDLFENQNRLPEYISTNLFRIYQEALNNIVRHSKASQVWVRFAVDQNQIQLEIRDDGQGFSVDRDLMNLTTNGHYGLAGMNERTETIGGKLAITSQPGQGTTIKVTLPLQENI